MLNPEILIQGLTIMCVGMSVVFSFLIILVFATMISANMVKLLNKLCPLAETSPKTTKSKSNDEAEIALAIVAAMAQK